ncbi:dymeclin-like [Amphibalanus amphitrite]|uniref:dymeclin-like n=1 Tax=Amphibalanus amphitrite TaxID=1232801 RepID=UPI001C90706B|nr:dymeclin-like [Amphibalanus amphitrite]XP_043232637.1 dymeclin-like [Amphibalanus amphitrite]XP_043232638.1 dymeclin-like [Amphibalanus amphitrite]XP_043232639.1 dymeclin-like [Amphibalanus amphitrite]XP_043232640.1 dymeclin-like [Amphibalanus amphitrite]
MGAAVSGLKAVSESTELAKLAGTEPLPADDPFWQGLLQFQLSRRLTREDDKRLEEAVSGLFNTFVTNNPETGNLGALVRVFLGKASELKAAAQLDSRLADQTLNALLVLRCACKLSVQLLSEEELVRQLEAPAPAGQLETLLTGLVEVLVDVPLTDATYYIHLESLNTLLVLLACQLYSVKQAQSLVVYRTLMSGRCAMHAPILVRTLLRHTVARQPVPDARYTGGGSLVFGLASGLWSALTLGYGSQPAVEERAPGGLPPLAQQSLHTLLVLGNHCTGDRQLFNPFRQALFHMTDLQDPAETHLADAGDGFGFAMSSLYSLLCSPPCTDQTTLLLYLLIHKNTAFRHFVLARTDLDALVLPTLRVLYHAPESSSHHIYMSLIVLLILSEDELFNRSVHSTMLHQVSWYTERPLTEISLGGLLILVVIRTIQYNMTKMRDKYLHTNCLAALANMSAEFRQLHPYVCQRLVSLFEVLAKRHGRQLEQLRAAAAAADASQPDEGAVQDLAVLEEVLRMLLEIINSCLTAQLVHNPNLVYTLLYKRGVFELYRTHPNFQDITHNIDTVLLFFSSKLESLHKDIGVRDVHAVIQDGAKKFPLERLKKFPELKFKYVEENEPEDFFIPYVWSLVVSGGDLHWSTAAAGCLLATDAAPS